VQKTDAGSSTKSVERKEEILPTFVGQTLGDVDFIVGDEADPFLYDLYIVTKYWGSLNNFYGACLIINLTKPLRNEKHIHQNNAAILVSEVRHGVTSSVVGSFFITCLITIQNNLLIKHARRELSPSALTNQKVIKFQPLSPAIIPLTDKK
jgi:hypothetical protein